MNKLFQSYHKIHDIHSFYHAYSRHTPGLEFTHNHIHLIISVTQQSHSQSTIQLITVEKLSIISEQMFIA